MPMRSTGENTSLG